MLGRKDRKKILAHLSIISSQVGEKSKKVTENEQINEFWGKENDTLSGNAKDLRRK